jgi:hypothetical protein
LCSTAIGKSFLEFSLAFLSFRSFHDCSCCRRDFSDLLLILRDDNGAGRKVLEIEKQEGECAHRDIMVVDDA